jgi:hypothetical protein
MSFAMVTPERPTAPPSEDDELDELPPIDGEDGEAADEDAATDDLDDASDEAMGDPFDDATGEDDPVDEELVAEAESAETGWLEDAAEADGLDVGTPETFGDESEGPRLLEGAEEGEAKDDDDDLGFGEGAAAVGDAGEEGFEDEDEELREDDLPRIDQDGAADDELGDAELGETFVEDDLADEASPPWDDRAWERADREARGFAAVSAIACDARGVVVGGAGLARVDAAGIVTVLEAMGLRGGAPASIATDGDVIVVSTPRAGVLVSTDGGRSFAEANGWRAVVARDDAGGAPELALAGADLWGRTRAGALVYSGDRGGRWERAAPERRFEALAVDAASGDVVALARDGLAGVTIARGAAGRLVLASRPGLPSGRVVGLASDGGRVAVGVADRGVFVPTEPGGATAAGSAAWSRVEGTANVTALAFGARGALLVALASEAEARAWIVLAPHGGSPRIVAEIGDAPRPSGTALIEDGAPMLDDDEPARIRALAWDDRAEVLWAAGPFGFAALRSAAPKSGPKVR